MKLAASALLQRLMIPHSLVTRVSQIADKTVNMVYVFVSLCLDFLPFQWLRLSVVICFQIKKTLGFQTPTKP